MNRKARSTLLTIGALAIASMIGPVSRGFAQDGVSVAPIVVAEQQKKSVTTNSGQRSVSGQNTGTGQKQVGGTNRTVDTKIVAPTNRTVSAKKAVNTETAVGTKKVVGTTNAVGTKKLVSTERNLGTKNVARTEKAVGTKKVVSTERAVGTKKVLGTTKAVGTKDVVRTKTAAPSERSGLRVIQTGGTGSFTVRGRNFSVWRGSHRVRYGNSWRTFITLGALGSMVFGASNYYPYAYISAPESYCEGLTEDGCRLVWRRVETLEGDLLYQCVAYCPRQ